MAVKDETVLAEADRIIHGDRRTSYGGPKESFTRIALVWGSILGHPVTATQVALCMAGLKLIREANKTQRDNLVDIAGYAGLAAILENWDREGEQQ